MDEIRVLQEENEQLRKKMSSMEQRINEYAEILKEFVRFSHGVNNAFDEMQSEVSKNLFVLQSHAENVFFEVNDPRIQKDEFFYPHIIDETIAVQEIIDHKKSIARFGDGEFSIINGHSRCQFQKADLKLGNRLNEVLQSEMDQLMIGIADNYGSLDKYENTSANGIRAYMRKNIRREHMQLLSRERPYYDAYLSRPYIMRNDRETDMPKRRFEHLQQIWDQRNVIMIEGEQTRLGVGNDLFHNCKSIRRILAPVKNAYDRYQDILEFTLSIVRENDLILLAVGPAAAVFAYDFTLQGIQAVDIGHVDLEYEWFLRGSTKRDRIENKYTNECDEKQEADAIHDPLYESQVIGKFVEQSG